MNTRNVLFACLLAVTISGCAVGPDYQRPDQSMPQDFNQQKKGQGLEASYADLKWRSVYSNQLLQQLIEEALAASPDLLIAEARVREAEAVAGVVRSELLPQLGLSWTTDPIVRPDGKNLASTYTGGAAISWEIDLWGKLRRADEAARADLLSTEANRRALVSSLISRVADLYHQLIATRQVLEVSLRTAKNQRDALNLIKRLSNAGISSAAEERQQEVAIAVTEATLPTLRQLIVRYENGLSILLGRIPGPVRVDASANTPLPEFIPAGIPSRLLERRPDLMAVEQQLVAANARVGEAKARFFPSFSLTGLFGGISTSASDFLSGGASTVASLGFNGLQPLFAGGFFVSNYEASLAQLDQALISYRKAVLTSLAEVSNGLVAYQEAGNLQRVQKVRVEAARESLRLADLRFRAGVVSFIEVLDAQRQLFAAETAEVESLLDRHLALSSVYLALGGGW